MPQASLHRAAGLRAGTEVPLGGLVGIPRWHVPWVLPAASKFLGLARNARSLILGLASQR